MSVLATVAGGRGGTEAERDGRPGGISEELSKLEVEGGWRQYTSAHICLL